MLLDLWVRLPTSRSCLRVHITALLEIVLAVVRYTLAWAVVPSSGSGSSRFFVGFVWLTTLEGWVGNLAPSSIGYLDDWSVLVNELVN